MIHIYHGNGKGKTTASIGLLIRAIGRDFHGMFAQFMKNDSSGEIKILTQLEQIETLHASEFYGFTRNMNDEQKERMKQQYAHMLDRIEETILSWNGEAGIVVMDEILHGCNQKLVEEERVLSILNRYKEQTEFVLTGMFPSKALCEMADYITEMKKEKHPYDLGVMARKGIEL